MAARKREFRRTFRGGNCDDEPEVVEENDIVEEDEIDDVATEWEAEFLRRTGFAKEPDE